ncbi:hypothetical protein CWRG_02025 [Chthonomonas calidirosea]|uniref:DUF2007 domain-containing protein n=1 Tax=Chthonomonas calidirosea (strain DSM 23976 / ICMP 18418 / T49) TaxID=1303518 RepID=S0EZJ6_CHTCT|nr:hypothetical protein [Chthonomonas calidirosea]CCW35858.1 hypothetical protein CCALI_02051 [Chthonomonas calidirosea T49]CEK18009.1 hypothetical protein CP488_02038 [Chthonomonas calidirosea]CEK18011.1 hypothetical protein CWRG_02025 [Chthonomonas calidirosea]CEK19037.1 hypothetical protein CTKA_02044 [Chthonomonas calidirosea]
MSENQPEQQQSAFVAVYEASNVEEALALRATLAAEGFAVLLPSDGVNPVLGALHASVADLAPLTLYVPAEQAAEARVRIASLTSGEDSATEEEES